MLVILGLINLLFGAYIIGYYHSKGIGFFWWQYPIVLFGGIAAFITLYFPKTEFMAELFLTGTYKFTDYELHLLQDVEHYYFDYRNDTFNRWFKSKYIVSQFNDFRDIVFILNGYKLKESRTSPLYKSINKMREENRYAQHAKIKSEEY
jgi:hypothetical protein